MAQFQNGFEFNDRRTEPSIQREYFSLSLSASSEDEKYSVQQSAEKVSLHLDKSCQLMHETAEAILHVPELEVKLLLGRHLNDFAIIVDSIIDRFKTLGEPVRPAFFEKKAPRIEASPLLISGTFELLKHRYERELPEFFSALQEQLSNTHHVWDEPTVRLLSVISNTLLQQQREYEVLKEQLDDKLPRWRVSEIESAGRLSSSNSEKLSWTIPERAARDNRFQISPTIPRRPQGGSLADNAIADFHIAMMHIEVPTVELCCENILLFPEMPWEFKRDMARQIWDETRHAQAFYDRILELGGKIGAFPADFNIKEMTEGCSLALRLSVNQQIGEWIGVDSSLYFGKYYLEQGDERSAKIFEFVARDEINHTHFGNKWMRYLLKTEEAVSRVHERALEIRAAAGLKMDTNFPFPFNQWICEVSGFEASQIARMLEVRKRPPQ